MASFYLCPISYSVQFFNNTGVILSGGQIGTYQAGSTTPQATYSDNGGITLRANPIILNSAGRIPDSGEVWVPISTPLKLVLSDSNSNLITTLDNLQNIGDPTTPGNSGSFTATLTGMTGTVTGTINWTFAVNQVFMYAASAITGTSNSTGMTMTGVPSNLLPTINTLVPCGQVVNNSAFSNAGGVSTSNTGTFTFALLSSNQYTTGVFTNTGTKGLNTGWSINYPIR